MVATRTTQHKHRDAAVYAYPYCAAPIASGEGKRQKKSTCKLIVKGFFPLFARARAREREKEKCFGEKEKSRARIRGPSSAISVTATSRPGPPNTSRGGTTPAREAATPPPRAISARILPEPSSPTPRRATRCVIAAACRRRRAGFLRGERPRVGHRQRGRGCRGPKASGRGLPQAGPRHAGCHQLRAERGCVASDAISPGALHGPRKEMSRRLVRLKAG